MPLWDGLGEGGQSSRCGYLIKSRYEFSLKFHTDCIVAQPRGDVNQFLLHVFYVIMKKDTIRANGIDKILE